MRKFYSVVNVITFIVLIFYLTSSNQSPQLQHGALMLGIISLLTSGYMTFQEYTEDPDEKLNEQVNSIKNTYKTKLEEFTKNNQSSENNETYLSSLRDENKQLVSDVVQTKKIVNKLTNIIQTLENTSSHQQPNMNMDMDIREQNYHMERSGKPQISNVDNGSGPPNAMLTSDDNNDISSRIKEYESFDVGKPPSTPPVPDFLKSISTSKNDNGNDMNY